MPIFHKPEDILLDMRQRYGATQAISMPRENPTEYVAEVGRRVDLNHSTAIAYIKQSQPHMHEKTTEVYEVLAGAIYVYVDGKRHLLYAYDKLVITPGQVHYARVIDERFDEWTVVKVLASPPWSAEDHHLIQP